MVSECDGDRCGYCPVEEAFRRRQGQTGAERQHEANQSSQRLGGTHRALLAQPH